MFSKKVISLLLSLLLMVSLSASALATDAFSGTTCNTLEVKTTPDISLRYSYTTSISASLSFSGNTAYCKGSVLPRGSYNVSVTVTLYKQNGNAWSYVASWSGSSSGGSQAVATGTASVTSGTYMVMVRGNVGGGLEYPTKSVTRTN